MSSDAPVFERGRLPDDWTKAVLPIDKPKGWTSFDVVRRLRGLLQVRKVGHAGTLDPAATGLLICLVGRATKRMESFMHMPKAYEAVMRLGESTPSHDAETPVSERASWEHLARHDLERVREQFIGPIEQVPPMYSAVKVKGERLYKKARRGEVVDRKPSVVTIHDLTLGDWQGPDVTFSVRCSKGTYIRALARDMGQSLGVGAHLVALRRTAIGPYNVAQAWSMDGLKGAVSSARVP